jgi:hypothetical protein
VGANVSPFVGNGDVKDTVGVEDACCDGAADGVSDDDEVVGANDGAVVEFVVGAGVVTAVGIKVGPGAGVVSTRSPSSVFVPFLHLRTGTRLPMTSSGFS